MSLNDWSLFLICLFISSFFGAHSLRFVNCIFSWHACLLDIFCFSYFFFIVRFVHILLSYLIFVRFLNGIIHFLLENLKIICFFLKLLLKIKILLFFEVFWYFILLKTLLNKMLFKKNVIKKSNMILAKKRIKRQKLTSIIFAYKSTIYWLTWYFFVLFHPLTCFLSTFRPYQHLTW